MGQYFCGRASLEVASPDQRIISVQVAVATEVQVDLHVCDFGWTSCATIGYGEFTKPHQFICGGQHKLLHGHAGAWIDVSSRWWCEPICRRDRTGAGHLNKAKDHGLFSSVGDKLQRA